MYVGQWASGAMDGKGTLTWPDKSVYEGDFQNNHMHGIGKMTGARGRVYEGRFLMGKEAPEDAIDADSDHPPDGRFSDKGGVEIDFVDS